MPINHWQMAVHDITHGAPMSIKGAPEFIRHQLFLYSADACLYANYYAFVRLKEKE